MVSPAEAHYVRVQQLQAVALLATRRAWDGVDPDNISRSWSRQLAVLAPIVADQQLKAAVSGSEYGVLDLAERGTYVAPTAFVNPQAFAGVTAGNVPLEQTMYAPAVRTKQWIAAGYTATQALQMGRSILDGIARTSIADAGRQAASVDIAARPGVGYVRMLNPPSCDSCAILAGKFYRWNKGFRRHNRCDCIHRPSTSVDAAKSEGLIDDPYEYFQGLSESEQNAVFGRAKAQAIRDGSDIYRVQNSWRGRDGLTTFEGTSRGGYASNLRGRRLTPEGIYKQAGTREEAQRLLREHGYLIGPQRSGGIVVGQREGFGALGRGGTRRGASNAVLDARATGVRDPNVRATMTSAERRLFDAEQRFNTAAQGINPYSRNGTGWTPEIAARAETDYRRWLRTGGDIYPS